MGNGLVLMKNELIVNQVFRIVRSLLMLANMGFWGCVNFP